MWHAGIWLTLEQLQSHSEAEEGVNTGVLGGSGSGLADTYPRLVPRLKDGTKTQTSVSSSIHRAC